MISFRLTNRRSVGLCFRAAPLVHTDADASSGSLLKGTLSLDVKRREGTAR